MSISEKQKRRFQKNSKQHENCLGNAGEDHNEC